MRSTGKDNNFGIERSDGRKRASTGDTKREDRQSTNTASDEMGVLRAEVEDKD